MKLYTYQGNFRAFKALIAAQYNNVDIEVEQNFEMSVDNRTPEFLAKSPLGKVPVLETDQGSLFESNAIARYIARIRRDTELYGKTFFESGLIDSWVDFCSHELELPIVLWLYPVLNYMPYHAESSEKAKADVRKALTVLENHLLTHTFLVGEKVTLADIVTVSVLVYPFKFLFDKAFRADFPCVTRWFNTCVHQPQFAAVVGEVTLCQTALCADGEAPAAPAEGKKAKKAKKGKKGGDAPADDDADGAAAPPPAAEEPPKKKPKHPLAILDSETPSPMSSDAFKFAYRASGTDYAAIMDSLWNIYDANGWGVFWTSYKYCSEYEGLSQPESLTVCQLSNFVGGFLQRTDEIRKWAFGTMYVTERQGEEGAKYEITGCWLFRGATAEHMIEANPDACHFEWSQADVEAQKEKINTYWTNYRIWENMGWDEPPMIMEGRKVLECKLFV
jgi:elongation factor 1-gamma